MRRLKTFGISCILFIAFLLLPGGVGAANLDFVLNGGTRNVTYIGDQ